MTSGIPTSLHGYVDDSFDSNVYGGVIDSFLEQSPALVHPQSVQTFARMRHDPQLTAVLAAYARAIEGATWEVDGSGCRDEVTQLIADDLGLPIAGVDEKPTGARRRGFKIGRAS